ncbi:TAXI family TRAP transporter solute-binding subunit [Ferrovibrio xuzhouensis]|uniref:TAXI family TRAP transporter solute-binding subunit n=1 Tax=Ferrovibrio xuzhouensis TaxID=1576914 RepID=A0ABV7VDH1_9PROT
MKRLMLAAVAVLTLAIPLHAQPARAQQPLGIGTMGQGTLGYAMGAAIATVLQEKAGLSARIQPSSGTSSYLPLINSGELDFGIANILEAREAMLTGDRKLQNLRFASVLFPFRVGLFVKKDSPAKTIADLKGLRVTYGYSSQATIETVIDGLLANGGLKRDDVRRVLVPNVVRGADDFASGKVDAAFFAIGGGKVSEVDASVGGIRFIPLSDQLEAIARMTKAVPGSYITMVQPRNGMAGVDQPIAAMAYDYMLLTGKHVPDATVHKALKALADNKEALVASLAAFNAFDKARMAKSVDLPVHPGAQAFFAEAGLKK